MASLSEEAECSGNTRNDVEQETNVNFTPLLNDVDENDSTCDSEHSLEEFSFGLNLLVNPHHKSEETGLPFGERSLENDSVANECMTVLNDLDHVLDITLLGSYDNTKVPKNYNSDKLHDENSKESDMKAKLLFSLDSKIGHSISKPSKSYDFSLDMDEYSNSDIPLDLDSPNNRMEDDPSISRYSTSDDTCFQNYFDRHLSTRATYSNHKNAPKLNRSDQNRKSLSEKWSSESIFPENNIPILQNTHTINMTRERPSETNDDLVNKSCDLNRRLRDSMRNIEPIEIPDQEIDTNTIHDGTTVIHEEMTLPVRLFLERNSNVNRPSSAPSAVSRNSLHLPSSAPERTGETVVGRRALREATASLEVTPEHVISVTRLRRNNEQARRHSRTRERDRRDHSVSRSVSLASSSNSSANSTVDSHIPDGNENDRVDNTVTPEKNVSIWPSVSFALSCLSCTIGIFNISRFSVFGMRFGINFIAQFLILSLVFGIPLFVLQLCLGHTLRKSIMDMWYISPIFQGIGITLWVSQAIIGVYTIVGVSWLFTYLRDSFVTKSDLYKWEIPFTGSNITKLSHSIPLYFNEIVLQRTVPENIATQSPMSIQTLGTIKFQVAFNLAVIWLILFVAHCRGYRSSGKAVYVFLLPPLLGMLMMCVRLTMSYNELNGPLFPETIWSDFFINSKSWSAAAQEVFLTWGLLGGASQTVGSDGAIRGMRSIFLASTIAIVATIFVLYIGSLIGVASLAVLVKNGYRVLPSSYEDEMSVIFMRSWRMTISNTPVKYMPQYASMLGITTWQPSYDPAKYSGYQPLTLPMDLVPAAVAVLGTDSLSPFWPVIFYLTMILFGLSQQLAIWRGVISGIVSMDLDMLKKKETTVTLFSSIVGFLIGLPLTTDAGLNILHWLDYVTVGCWCQCLLWSVLIVAVFAVRGRPFTGDRIVSSVFPCSPRQPPSLVASLLSFTWNVLLPVLLLVVCVVDFKAGKQRQLYVWRTTHDRYTYWSSWSRQLGGSVQLVLLLLVPLTAIIQVYRYLNSNHADILVRIQNLYRPILPDPNDSDYNITILSSRSEPPLTANTTNEGENSSNPVTSGPPPKYSPPPSYSTATGAAAAQLARIRRSFRRGVARLTSSWTDATTATTPPDNAPPITDISEENVTARISRGVRSASVRFSNSSSNLLRNVLRRSLQRNIGCNGGAAGSRSTEQLLARPDLLADHIFTVSGGMETSLPMDTSV